MAKKLKRDCIAFYGQASNDVTGSEYYIQFGKYKCLLECGLYQSSSNNMLSAYWKNNSKFQFKPSEIDYVFVNHSHVDHIGAIPRLVHHGFHGKIITTSKTAAIMKPLLLNSCYIIQEEAKFLSKRIGRNYWPIYELQDVYNTLDLIEVYDEYNHVYELNDQIKFQWLENAHCLGAAQLQLILSDGKKLKRILYTSDMGALNTKNHYVENTVIPDMYSDVTIMESTYGANSKNVKSKREHDLKHLKTAVNTVIGRGGCIVMPCFSFSRTQELLTALYSIYGDDDDFKTEVVVDSTLSCDICKLYSQILDGEDLELWEKVSSWENVRYISERGDSRACLADSTPKIIISASGFCTNGRIVNYLKKYLRDPKSMIVFSGFTGDNESYLSYRIKNYRNQRHIMINKEKIPNKADCITLTSFSSHANQNDLVTFGSSLNTEKVVLVHGSEESKKTLAAKLREAISKNDKSYKVVCSTKDMVIYL